MIIVHAVQEKIALYPLNLPSSDFPQCRVVLQRRSAPSEGPARHLLPSLKAARSFLSSYHSMFPPVLRCTHVFKPLSYSWGLLQTLTSHGRRLQLPGVVVECRTQRQYRLFSSWRSPIYPALIIHCAVQEPGDVPLPLR